MQIDSFSLWAALESRYEILTLRPATDQGANSIRSIMTLHLLGLCHIAWFENKGGVLVIGCVHTNMLKFWPLPMEQPWWEDLPVKPGERVGRLEDGQCHDTVLCSRSECKCQRADLHALTIFQVGQFTDGVAPALVKTSRCSSVR